ncbi:50S ribosomal protein L11 methyltransferase [Desulfolucanica intricata]|uniref:50S ribosomal protein L11 methyltransferase n=1 Tax=Desulfolucanica intricata TaxID=1285191 RepID=UPI001EE494B8|nr:50S ribosomal protein L11 methyltransferase [Desulfolucanica intricata]
MEVAVRVLPEGLEPIASIFEDLGTGGVLIEDPTLIARYKDEPGDTQVVSALISGQGDLPVVKGYLPVDERLPERLDNLKLLLDNLFLEQRPEISTSELPETNWATAWQAYYKPVAVGEKLVVKPSWEDYCSEDGRVVIELDPGMAFGSGTHATTTLCMQLLERHLKGGEVVIDVGTGSGILAAAAAKLGASKVMAVDNDPVAVRVARENMVLNNIQEVVKVFEGNLLQVVTGLADLIVANIIADVIINLTKDVPRVLVPGGKFIASGIIKDREKDVQRALKETGFTVLEVKREGEWAAIVSILGE